MRYKDIKEMLDAWQKSETAVVEVEKEILLAITNEALAHRRQVAAKARAKLVVPKNHK